MYKHLFTEYGKQKNKSFISRAGDSALPVTQQSTVSHGREIDPNSSIPDSKQVPETNNCHPLFPLKVEVRKDPRTSPPHASPV